MTTVIKFSILVLTISCLAFGCTQNPLHKKKNDNELSRRRESASFHNVETKTLCTGWYYVLDSNNNFRYQLDKSEDTFCINPAPIVIKDNIISTEIYESNGHEQNYVGLSMQLDEYGTKEWAVATAKYTSKKLAFILDNKLIMAAKVNSQITNGITAINRSEYNRQDIEKFKKQLDKK